jgi:hypothetical protein
VTDQRRPLSPSSASLMIDPRNGRSWPRCLTQSSRLRAERKAGDQMEKATKGSAQPGVGRRGADGMPSDETRTLSDFGITYDQSSRWQKLAAVPATHRSGAEARPSA